MSFNSLTWKKIARALVVGNLSAVGQKIGFSSRVFMSWFFWCLFSGSQRLCVPLVSGLIVQHFPQPFMKFPKGRSFVGEEKRSFHLWQISQTLQSWHKRVSRKLVEVSEPSIFFKHASLFILVFVKVCKLLLWFKTCTNVGHTARFIGVSLILHEFKLAFTCYTQR